LLIDGKFLDELCMAMILAGPLSVQVEQQARPPASTPLHAASSALVSRVS
jgi:hypothetical protein